MNNKFCEDCEHFRLQPGSSGICVKIVIPQWPIRPHGRFEYAELARMPDGRCTPEALLFEPRRTFIDKVMIALGVK